MKSLHDFLPATLHRGYFNTVVPSRVPRPEQAEIRHSQFLLIIPVYFFIPDKKKPPCLTCVTNPEMTLLPYRDEEGCWGQCTVSKPCGDELTALSRGDWGCQAAAAPFRQLVASQTCSQACGHCRTPTGFYQLWLTSLASGSCLFIYKARHIREQPPRENRPTHPLAQRSHLAVIVICDFIASPSLPSQLGSPGREFYFFGTA